MDRWVGKVALVTGASSGIGAAIAEALVKEGMLVVGLARRLEMVEELSASLKGAKGKLFARRGDIGKEEDLQSAFEWIKSELGGVDVLVNNAGVVKIKKVLDDDNDSFRNIININFMATAICIREAVASMQSRKVAGHVININRYMVERNPTSPSEWLASLAFTVSEKTRIYGHPYPIVPVSTSLYGPSKFAVTSLTDTVRKELGAMKSRIKITSVSPGFVVTEMTGGGANLDANAASTIPSLQPKDIADAVVYLIGTPENVQVTEFTIRPTGEVC